jgi:hypothetical protein
METVELSTQQRPGIAGLPEDYRVVGVDGRAPLVRKPTGQVLHHNGQTPHRGHDRGQERARRPPRR